MKKKLLYIIIALVIVILSGTTTYFLAEKFTPKKEAVKQAASEQKLKIVPTPAEIVTDLNAQASQFGAEAATDSAKLLSAEVVYFENNTSLVTKSLATANFTALPNSSVNVLQKISARLIGKGMKKLDVKEPNDPIARQYFDSANIICTSMSLETKPNEKLYAVSCGAKSDAEKTLAELNALAKNADKKDMFSGARLKVTEKSEDNNRLKNVTATKGTTVTQHYFATTGDDKWEYIGAVPLIYSEEAVPLPTEVAQKIDTLTVYGDFLKNNIR